MTTARENDLYDDMAATDGVEDDVFAALGLDEPAEEAPAPKTTEAKLPE